MKKFLSFFIVLSVLASALMGFAVSVSADPAPATWDGTTAAAFAGGDGTEGNPYQISNGAELALLQAKIADGEQAANYYNKSYVLTADIVLNTGDATTWGTTAPANGFTPIGEWNNTTSTFGGHFDGQGHTISGLYITNTYESGVGGIDGGIALFGCVQGGAEIKNLILVNSYIESTNTGGVGAIVGQTDRSSEADILVQNIYTDAILVGGGTECGGIIGNLSDSNSTFTAGRVTVNRATFAGSVSATNYVGGIIGNGRNVGVTITNCLVYASIRGSGSYVAGIMAKSKSNETLTPTGENIPTVAYCVVAGTEIVSTASTKYNRAYVSQNSGTVAYKTAVHDCYDAIGITDTRNTTDADNEDIASALLYGSYEGTGAINWATWSSASWAVKADDIVRPKGVAESFELNVQQQIQTEYTVTWMNGDDVLAEETYSVGEMPTYKGSDPTKAEDEHYTFTFNRWTPEIKAVTENATYYAEFYRTRKPSATTAAEETTTAAPTTTTTAPATTEAEKPAKSGCKSVIGGSALVLVAVMGVGAFSFKKKED